ncbi:MAG TPA: hypothetical protein VKN99_11230 [Polyangia bacterium]|nr:hypothetical protein [Polyangia bacterium]
MKPALVCSVDALAPGACKRHQEQAEWLFTRVAEVAETESGYGFRFDFGADPEAAEILATWLLDERRCCAFLQLELGFEPERGPIWLRVQGPPEVKTFVAKTWVEKLAGRRLPVTP